MSTAFEEDAVISGYVDTVGTLGDKGYEIRLGQVELILADVHRLNSMCQQLLTALQRAVPTPQGDGVEESTLETAVGQLKGALSNVIIMQTRLNEREEGLLELLRQVREQNSVDGVPVERAVVEGWARVILKAYHRIT